MFSWQATKQHDEARLDNRGSFAALRMTILGSNNHGRHSERSEESTNQRKVSWRIPHANGSAGPIRSEVSAITWAVPEIVGTILSPCSRYRALKVLPTMLSCTHSSPGASLPSAARHASLALVPVPQGERS